MHPTSPSNNLTCSCESKPWAKSFALQANHRFPKLRAEKPSWFLPPLERNSRGTARIFEHRRWLDVANSNTPKPRAVTEENRKVPKTRKFRLTTMDGKSDHSEIGKQGAESTCPSRWKRTKPCQSYETLQSTHR